MKPYQFKMPYLHENLEKSLLFLIFYDRVQFENFVFLCYSNFLLQIEHNYIQSICFTLNLWYWMLRFILQSIFIQYITVRKKTLGWHFKYIWKIAFLEVYVFFFFFFLKDMVLKWKKIFYKKSFKGLVILVNIISDELGIFVLFKEVFSFIVSNGNY